MEEQRQNLGLIRGRRTALVNLILTGFIATISIRSAFSYHAHGAHWLIQSGLLPPWAALTINTALYLFLLWLFIGFFRGALGAERIVVAGWFLVIFLSPIQNIISVSLAAGIQNVKAACIVIAFFAAFWILMRSPIRGSIASDRSVSR